jgi:hypothetical protein
MIQLGTGQLTVQDSADEQPHFEQSIRASRSPTFVGFAMAKPARRVRRGMENFIMIEIIELGSLK